LLFQSVGSLVLRPLKEYSWANGNQRFCMYLPMFAKIIFQNAILSKHAAHQTQYFERTLHFQREMWGKR